jgi:hypothetical protein
MMDWVVHGWVVCGFGHEGSESGTRLIPPPLERCATRNGPFAAWITVADRG